MAMAKGIVNNEDSNLLAKNGGTIVLSKHWASSIMTQMNFVKRCGNSNPKSLVPILKTSGSSSFLISR